MPTIAVSTWLQLTLRAMWNNRTEKKGCRIKQQNSWVFLLGLGFKKEKCKIQTFGHSERVLCCLFLMSENLEKLQPDYVWKSSLSAPKVSYKSQAAWNLVPSPTCRAPSSWSCCLGPILFLVAKIDENPPFTTKFTEQAGFSMFQCLMFASWNPRKHQH